MPRVNAITPAKRAEEDIYNFIGMMRYAKNIRLEDIAGELGISHQAVSYKLRNRTLSLSDFVQIMDYMGRDAAECIRRKEEL